jgi:hypothetical protein
VELLQHLVAGGEHDLSWLQEEEGQHFFLNETWTLKVPVINIIIEQCIIGKNRIRKHPCQVYQLSALFCFSICLKAQVLR